MTRQAPLTCREVETALFGGATRDRSTPASNSRQGRPGAANDAGTTRRAAIEAHLAGCPACAGLQRALAGDAAAIRQHMDTADWLPVADRVFAALPQVATDSGRHRPEPVPGTGHVATRPAPTLWSLPSSRTPRPTDAAAAVTEPGGPVSSPGRRQPTRPQPVMGARQRSWHPTGRIAAALRATCLILLGLGIGIGLQQAWPHLFSARPGEEPGLTTSDGTGGDGDYAALPASGTGAVIDSTAGDNAYVPAPGNNPPLAVPGNGTANRISAIQNRDTWQAVREQAGELAPLLYPPIPPGAFESVAVGRVGPAEVLVRYNGSGMRLMVGAGTAVLDVAAVMTIPSAQQFQATVRGRPATVSMAQSSTADADPNALAPGMVLSVTWTEPGATLDAAGNVQATSVPYAVAATGVPVDVVMAFAGSLVPIETGWDTLLDGLPNGEAPPVPATMPAGFGPATLLAPPVGAGTAVTDVAPGWTIASSRAGTGATSDLIVFTAAAAPAADPATGPTTAIRVAGQDGTLSTSGTLGTASARWEIRWQADSTEYGITLTGPGITASEVDSLIDGMTTRLERLPVADRAA